MTDKPTLTSEGFQELWKQAVHNKAHRILHDAQDLMIAYQVLASSGLIIGNSMDVVDRDIQLVLAHCRQLTGDMSKADSVIKGYCDRLKEKEDDEGV